MEGVIVIMGVCVAALGIVLGVFDNWNSQLRAENRLLEKENRELREQMDRTGQEAEREVP